MAIDGKISSMELLQVVTGEEYFEVIKRDGSGRYQNYRVSVDKIRTNVGMSAYESAVENGFVGTEEEWLASLKGQDIYQLAVANGFVGTEEEYLESLVGTDGEDGKDIYTLAVEEGFTGTKEEYLESLHGKDIYQLAVEKGFQGTEEEYLESLKGVEGPQGETGPEGKSLYDLAVEDGFTGTLEEYLESIKGEKGDAGEEGPAGASAYEQAQAGGYTGTETEFINLLNNLDRENQEGKGVSGAVFIRDVEPVNSADNVGNKVYANDGKTLLSCNSTTSNVILTIDAITGTTSYKPVVKYDDIHEVILTQNPNNDLIWTGRIRVDDFVANDQGVASVSLKHNDGATGTVLITTDVPPVITSANFTGTYPGAQTELKAGDLVNIAFSSDVPVVGYEIRNQGALEGSTGVLTGSNTTYTATGLKIADRGNAAQLLPFEIRVKKASGAWSAWYSSDTEGTEEFVNVVNLNNAKPTASFGAVVYPAGQNALQFGQTAEVAYTVTNNDTINVIALNANVEVVEFDQGVAKIKHVSGDYNANTQNAELVVTRTANGTSASAQVVIKYATVEPEISMTVPAARLRSGGNHGTQVQRYVVTLNSTQVLVEAPEVEAPAGTWDSAAWATTNGGLTWTRRLNVHDNDQKGTFQFTLVSAKSPSGLVSYDIVNGKDYVLGGFVKRQFSVSPFPNRQSDLGTMVSDVAKLQCSNLSKGQAGSLNFQYKDNQDDEVGFYTIIDGGNIWYNCDYPNASSNFSGAMVIELEELV